MLGSEWSRYELSRAAKKVVLIADALVDTDCMRQFPNLVRIPDVVVDAVVYWPFAAWPAGSPGMYDVDEAHMAAMNKALASEDGTAAYIRDVVHSYHGLDASLALIGAEKRRALSATSTSFLLDPFRKWIIPHEEVAL
jgi:glutaconate CoA-transferase subunit A